MKLNSIRFKASILYSVILAAILFVFAAGVYLTARTVLYEDIDGELRIKAEEISSILHAYEQVERSRQNNPVEAMLEMVRNQGMGTNQKLIVDDLWRSQLEVLNLKNDFISILTAKGQGLLKSKNFKEGVAALFHAQVPFSTQGVTYTSVMSNKYQLRVISLPIKYRNTWLVIRVGTPLHPVTHVLGKLLLFLAVAMAGLLLLTSFLGAYFASNSLKPVKKVVDLANRITHKDLTVRIKEENIDEEMQALVNSFNVMIGRLETSFGHINEFSSHAAHELKTPLAILRGEIELALDQERSPEEYKHTLEEGLAEIDRMIKVVKDLLLLSKLDYNPEIFNFEKLDLVPFLKEIAEQSKILAEPKNITVTFNLPEGELPVQADKVHLRRLFHNIIGNAIKYTPAGRSVTVTAQVKDKNAVIDVTDTGDGIPEKDLQKIFDKFYRAPKRDEDEETQTGTGLGLSIALSIARAHNGTIAVQSELGGGTTFTITLPLDTA